MMALAARIQSFFSPHYQAPLSIWEAFAAPMRQRQFGKNEIIKQSGKTERYLSFITRGVGGAFATRQGHEVCLDFSLENQFFGDYASFLRQQDSAVYTMAIEPMEIYSISFEELQKLYNSSPQGIHMARAAAESLFIEGQTRQLDLLTKTAEERYQDLFTLYPDLLLRLPQKHIASWLGIMPESLSRIRKQIAGV